MILLDTTKEISQASSSPIGLSNSDENESTLSFSELLKGVGSKKGDKVIQNGALILSFATDDADMKTAKNPAKNNGLLNLLKNDDTKTSNTSTVEPLALNPKVTEQMSTPEIKALVVDAKKYLETQILSSDEYKQSQIKELPKTLKGLVSAAKIIGLDISKISIEEIQVKSTNEIPKQQQQELKIAPALSNAKENLQENPKSDVRVQLSDVLNARKTPSSDDLKVQTKQLQSEKVVDELKISTQHPKGEKVVDELKAQVQHPKSEKVLDEIKAQVQHPKSEKVVDEIKAQVQHPKSEKVVDEIKAQVQHPKSEKVVEDTEIKVKQPLSDKTTNEPKSALKLQANEQKVQTPIQEQTPRQEQAQEIKQTPLFKAQTQTQHTTQQFVESKANNVIKDEEKTPKARADETLKLLLRGEKPQQSAVASMTADFSVATAKVLVPSAQLQTTQMTQTTQTLEQMLRGDSSDSKTETLTNVKTDTTGVLKADSFEVKLNEAKQMVKYLSSDVKTAIDDYKSPFTKIKVQLNPQNLGEIDLTIVQRGKNLHVNLSSNNAAINTLAMNINDLKVQLSNNGINNASFNFSNNQDGGSSASSQQQQQRQNEQQAQQEYNYFDNEETNEDILDSLEIVVPQYI